MSYKLVVSSPEIGSKVYDTTGVDSILFDFSLFLVNFLRQGDDLIISLRNDPKKQVTLQHYFFENETSRLPSIELDNGFVVNPEHFLATYDINTSSSSHTAPFQLGDFTYNEKVKGYSHAPAKEQNSHVNDSLNTEDVLRNGDPEETSISFVIPPEANPLFYTPNSSHILDDDNYSMGYLNNTSSQSLSFNEPVRYSSIIDQDLTNETIAMGEGDTHLSLSGDIIFDSTSIDGGLGYDVLELKNLNTLQNNRLTLSSLADVVSGFEEIDLSGASGTLHVDLDSLLELGIDSADSIQYMLLNDMDNSEFDISSLSAGNTLVIKADSNNVSFEKNWKDVGATVTAGGNKYNVYKTSRNEEQYFILLQAGAL